MQATRLDPPSAHSPAAFFGEARTTLRLGAPIVVSQLGQMGMNTTDTIMVGPLGPEALAAVGLSTALYIVGVVVCTGTIVGMAPLVSQAYGAGQRRRCRQVAVQGLWLAAVLSLPIMGICLAGGWLAGSLGQAPAVAGLAGDYMAALAGSVLPLLLFHAFRQYLEGMGITRPVMVMTFLGLAVNALANWVLIYGVEGWVPALGAVGSGWATTLVRWIMLAAMLVFVMRRAALRPFSGAGWRPDPPLLERILRIGAPVGGQYGLEVGLFSLAAVMIGWIGPLELAAHQIAINIAATTFMVALGISTAGSIRVGQHIGAGRSAHVRSAALATYALALGFMACCALIFVTLPEALIGLYTRDPEIVRLGATLLLFAAAFQLFDGGQVAGLAILRGGTDTAVPTVMTAIGYWAIGLPAAYLLGFTARWGAPGVWAGLTIGLAAVALLLAVRVRRRYWRAAASPAAAREAGARPRGV